MKIAARWLWALQQGRAIYSVRLISPARPRRHIIRLHVATAGALLEHIVADTKAEIDRHASWVGVSQYDNVVRDKRHNFAHYDISQQCVSIVLARVAAWLGGPRVRASSPSQQRHDPARPEIALRDAQAAAASVQRPWWAAEQKL